MRIFLDNCTSPVLASTLHGFVQHLGHSAEHIKDLPCGRSAPDVVWIEYLAATDDDWLVITGDLRIQRNPAERRAFRNAGLKGLVLANAYQSTPMHQQVSFFLWRWPDVEDLIRITRAPFLFEMPMARKSRLRSLPL
ncbi:PIN-like domain-containing protein [Methylobacterium planeticum]|uniref:VapC45 PIN like domain-containing protein n=1 Tax=Methylobacterium planeticum TaxID=2615211 RepID=A0A6N6MH70_9HYPH|nr:hypothetical protein [Methylobacterium planeticum]KAB1068819.1 hypothetical protein F6X51_26250 [Methylobacterium planeticum]